MSREQAIAQATPLSSPTRVVFKGLSERRMKVELRYADTQGGDYAIPLAMDVESHDYDSLGRMEWEHVLVPLSLRRYATPKLDTGESVSLATGGFVYVFRDGHLWRELKVVAYGALADVNLAREKGKDVRQATVRADTVLLVPYLLKNEQPQIEICYSPVQWSWARIQAMGGMAADDPRLAVESEVKVAPGADTDEARELRRLRMQRVDIEHDKAYFHRPYLKAPRGVTSNSAEDSHVADVSAPGEYRLTYYLFDPIGVAEGLKRWHRDRVQDLEVLVHSLQDGEYTLAKLIRSLLIAEQCQRRGQSVPADEKEVERLWPELYAQLSRGGDAASGTVASSINFRRLNEVLEGWGKVEREIAENLQQTGIELVEWMHGQEEERGTRFETALQDYFFGQESCPERMAAGVSLWLSLVEYLEFPAGREYLQRLADTGSPGLFDTLTNPPSQLVDCLRGWEDGELRLHADHEAVRALHPQTVTDLLTKAGTAVSSLVDLFIAVKASQGIAGLEWLAGLIQRLLGRETEAVTLSVLEALRLKVYLSVNFRTGLVQPVLTVKQYTTMIRELKDVRVPQIRIAGADPADTAAKLKSGGKYKALVGALGAVHLANVVAALGKVLAERDMRGWDVAVAGAATAAAAAFFAETVQPLVLARYEKANAALRSSHHTLRSTAAAVAAVPLWERQIARSAALRAQVVVLGSTVRAGVFGVAKLAVQIIIRYGNALALLIEATLFGRNAVKAWKAGNYGAGLGASTGLLGIGLLVLRLLLVGRTAAAGAGAEVIGVEVIGVAASRFGLWVSLILLVIGTVLVFAGEIYWQLSQCSELEKVLRHGWFGVRPYADADVPFQRPVSVSFNGSSLWLPGQLSLVDLGREFAAIMRVLCAFELDLAAGKEARPGSPWYYYDSSAQVSWEELPLWQGPKHIIICGTVLLSNVIPGATIVEPEIVVGNFPATYRFVLEPKPGEANTDILIAEPLSEVGRVTRVNYYCRVPIPRGVPLEMMETRNTVEFRVWLDVFGDGRVRVPLEGATVLRRKLARLSGRLPMSIANVANFERLRAQHMERLEKARDAGL